MGTVLNLKQLNGRTKSIYEKEFHKFRENFYSLYGIYPESSDPSKIQDYIDCCYPAVIKHSSVFKIHMAAVRKWYTDQQFGSFNLKAPKIDPEPLKILSVDQIRNIFKSAKSHPCSLMLRLIYESGIRLQEVTRIKVEDVDFENLTISIHNEEDSTSRKSNFSEVIKYDLMRLSHKREDNDFLFSLRAMKDGNTAPISRRTLQEFLNRISERNGTGRISIQTLRDSYAIHMIQEGYDLRLIMDSMGLKHIRSMSRYLKYIEDARMRKPVLRSPLCE